MAKNKEDVLQAIKELRNDKFQHVPYHEGHILDDAHNHVKTAMATYLQELEDKLRATPDTDQQAIDNISRSVTLLSLTSSGFALLNWGLKLMDNTAEFITGIQRADTDLLKQMGNDVLNTAKDFNSLLDAEEVSLGSKVWITLKAFTQAAIGAIKGLLNGLKEGYEKGEGLETVSSVLQGGVTGAISGFFKNLASSFSESLKDKGVKVEEKPSEEHHTECKNAAVSFRDTMSHLKEENKLAQSLQKQSQSSVEDKAPSLDNLSSDGHHP
ncbi:hypothetical protein [Legionella maioricensis]|uniref:Uncharacterized protein n=1 Tax=Legionella maioricensis TaxID=2896528 RepID=A0A9X2D1X3_9GAMM|nr:hypothetical protein [Legionella maioricensis]MCL9684824.1 hypothetical protein [Legionella maioricensis]MCL9688504.1 hypothetical protein [Legionella maioricensis]